jgi:hypothetical protein
VLRLRLLGGEKLVETVLHSFDVAGCSFEAPHIEIVVLDMQPLVRVGGVSTGLIYGKLREGELELSVHSSLLSVGGGPVCPSVNLIWDLSFQKSRIIFGVGKLFLKRGGRGVAFCGERLIIDGCDQSN